MPTAYLTRIVQFAAAHRYFRPEWTVEHNAEVFGACAREHGHGHTYQCTVTVRGTPDPETGMVMDLGLLDRLLSEEVVQRLDHRHLNLDVPEFARTIPTAENIVVQCWRWLEPVIPAGRLTRIVLWETGRNLVEYTGG